jgi:hypothetical protein
MKKTQGILVIILTVFLISCSKTDDDDTLKNKRIDTASDLTKDLGVPKPEKIRKGNYELTIMDTVSTEMYGGTITIVEISEEASAGLYTFNGVYNITDVYGKNEPGFPPKGGYEGRIDTNMTGIQLFTNTARRDTEIAVTIITRGTTLEGLWQARTNTGRIQKGKFRAVLK